MTRSRNLDILGAQAGSSPAELARAYRRRALQTHPDRVGGSVTAFRAVNAAYEALRQAPSDEDASDAGSRDVAMYEVDFGAARPGRVVWRTAILSVGRGPGGRVHVRPLSGAWWSVVDVLPVGRDKTRAALLFAARASWAGPHVDRVAVSVGGASADFLLRFNVATDSARFNGDRR